MVDAGDATKIRYKGASVEPVILHIPKLQVYGTAKVNQAVFSYPINEITIDNLSAGFEDADRVQLCRIYNGTTIKYQGGMANSPSTTKLFLRQLTEGDTGIASEIARTIADNDDVTIYTAPYPDAVRSRIDGVTGRTLKYRYLDFDNFPVPPTQYPPAVGRFGRNQLQAVSSGGTGSFTVPHTGVNNTYSWNSGSLTYAWELPTGVTLQGGYNLTDAVIEVDADPGDHVLKCTVDDDTAAVTTGIRRWVCVTDGADGDNPAFSDLYPPINLQITHEWGGFRGTFQLAITRGQHSDLMDYLYPGAPVFVQETPRFSNDRWATVSTVTAYAIPDQYFGYLRQYNNIGTTPDGRDLFEIEFVSPLIYYQSLPIPLQLLKEEDPPTTWQRVHPDLTHPAHLAFYLGYWHARQLFTSHDLEWDDDFVDRKKAAFLVDEESVGDALNRAAEFVPGGYMTCSADGSLYMKRLMHLMNSTDRGAKSTEWTFQPGDHIGDLNFIRNPLVAIGETEAAGFVYASGGNTTTSRARAGKDAPFSGLGRHNVPDFIALSTNDVIEIAENTHQFLNRPVKEVMINTRHNPIDPAMMAAVEFNLASYDPAVSGTFSNRGVVSKVVRNYSFTVRGVTVLNQIYVIPETLGEGAQTFDIEPIGDVATNVWCYHFLFVPSTLDGWTMVQGQSDATGLFGPAAGADSLRISITPGTTFTVTSAEAIFNTNWSGVDTRIAIINPSGGGVLASTGTDGSTSITLTYTYSGASTLILDFDREAGGIERWSTLRLTELYVRGTGNNPFGTNNCV